MTPAEREALIDERLKGLKAVLDNTPLVAETFGSDEEQVAAVRMTVGLAYKIVRDSMRRNIPGWPTPQIHQE